ncbi:MAG: hypothetical protein V4526_02775 [Patescibacteria group bacterium]
MNERFGFNPEQFEAETNQYGQTVETVDIAEAPKEEVLAILNALRNDVYLLGANDKEIPDIDMVIANYRKDKISAEDAIRAVQEVQSRKMEYR